MSGRIEVPGVVKESFTGCRAAMWSARPPRSAPRASLSWQFASVHKDLTRTENFVVIARLLGHVRRRAHVRGAALGLGAQIETEQREGYRPLSRIAKNAMTVTTANAIHKKNSTM
jgi:hypothetical protein